MLYLVPVGLKTTAFDRAESLGWTIPELAERAGLSVETLYKLRDGTRQPGQKAIEGLLRAFPSLGYRDLFVPSRSTEVQAESPEVQQVEVAA